MVTKISLNISLTESFYKEPEKDTTSSFQDIKIAFNVIIEDLTKAQTVATLIASGNFDIDIILDTFYQRSEIKKHKHTGNAITSYNVPLLTIIKEILTET